MTSAACQHSFLLVFEAGSHYVVGTVLELYVDQAGLRLTDTRLPASDRHQTVCLLSSGIKGGLHQAQYVVWKPSLAKVVLELIM